MVGHHLRPSWSRQSRLPFPEAGTAPQNEHLLPLSSLLLQRMLVAGPDVALSFQDGQSPWPVSGEWDTVVEVHGQRQDKMCWQSSSSSPSESSSHIHNISALIS